MKDKRPEEIAMNRYAIITPVLVLQEEGADRARIFQRIRELCTQHGISRRTAQRWLQGYQQSGIEGLKPKEHHHTGPNTIPEALIQEAILLRREVPRRSIQQIIEILEMEGKAKQGQLRRTTLQSKLEERGYSARQMKLYQQPGIAARRFARTNRNDLWHSDIKFTYQNVHGKVQQVYLVAFLDDATRYVLHAEFYDRLDQSIVEDCFRKAILKEGLPQRVYFDNGRQYRTRWMERACALLGIKLLFAKPYSPESTGKIERFNRTVGAFLDEVALKSPNDLDELNRYLQIWIAECYHSHKHEGLDDTPERVYRASTTELRFLPADVVAAAFLHSEQRRVDKAGCIQFKGKPYEVGVTLAGQKIDVVYDPADISKIWIEAPGVETFSATELHIGPHAGRRPGLPKTMLPAQPTTSRLLDGMAQRHAQHEQVRRIAIRYQGMDADMDVKHRSSPSAERAEQGIATDDMRNGGETHV